MWEATIDGRPLKFHLAGINNQNFIMQDEETGSWWQQVSGEAIFGPLKGRQLKGVFHDELTFATWRREHPSGGRVLKPDNTTAWRKFSENWEAKTAQMPVVHVASENDSLAPRTLVVGLKVNNEAKAYPLDALRQQSPLVDNLGGVPLVIIMSEDGQSVRAFEAMLNGGELEFYAKAGGTNLRLMDARTGSEWDFTGTAVSGQLAGRQLKKIALLKDYWFDWKTYNPSTALYSAR